MNKKESVVLQKYFSMCSVMSRRKSEEFILQGKVKINGKTAKLGDRVNPSKDKVTLNEKEIVLISEKKYYIMLNKPRGFVTTMSDEHGRKCVADLVKDIPARIYPVGRLDKDSEGLLLMTNDGDFANMVIHPSKNIRKTYLTTVRPNITDDQLTKLCTGVEIDGFKTRPALINVLYQTDDKACLEISIKEGRNRQIRKMCEQVGLKVIRLKRISIGTLKLGALKPGKWRNLSESELKSFV
ncbi:MAG: pseudouridine synthase [Clostridia bacterium]|nr:pseudouridine synthase [Clostridia bacterium]